MARWKAIENEIRYLVLSVGGPEIGEENVKLCIEFALPHLKHHNFLDTDEKKVERTIKGIYDKLVIHNLQTKADLLKDYCQLFLEGPLSKETDKENTTLHYSLLHLLLLTSISPTEDNIQGERIVTQQEKPSSYQRFDWGAYLLEGEDDLNEICDETDDEEEDDGSFLDMSGIAHEAEKVKDTYTIRSAADNETSVSLPEPEHIRDTLITKDTFDVKDFVGIESPLEVNSENKNSESWKWLHDHVMPPYWSESTGSRSGWTNENLSRSSRLLSDWNGYLSHSSCIDLTKKHSLLTEYKLIREVLWMLNGFENLFAFPWDGFRYQVNLDLVVSHLAESSLHHLLEEAATYGSMVKCIKEFIEATSCMVLPSPETSDKDDPRDQSLRVMFSFSTITQSHQAFSSAMSSQLDRIMSHVVELGNEVIKQEESMTLTKLMMTLEPQFKLLSILYYFIIEGVIRPLSLSSPPANPITAKLAKMFLESCIKTTMGKTHRCSVNQSISSELPSSSSSSSSTSKLTSYLLNTIYGCLVVTDQTAAFGDQEVSLIIQVWMETCKPYLEMLDAWMTSGSFHDPCNEFFIKRNEDWRCLSEKFWETSVCIEQNEDTSFIFLDHLLKEVVVTGKSLRLLNDISTTNRRGKFRDRRRQKVSKSLHQSYSESLMNELRRDEPWQIGSRDGGGDDDIDGWIERYEMDESDSEDDARDLFIDNFLGSLFSSPSVDGAFLATLRKQLRDTEPLLLSSILNSIKSCEDFQVRHESKDTNRSLSQPSLRPKPQSICSNFFLHFTLHKSLEGFVHRRYSESSTDLLDVIRNDCSLYEHLDSIKKYFLMESGRMMFDFYSSLFRAMDSGVEWSADGYLKFLLCESFSEEKPEELDRITIVVKDLQDPSTNIRCLESIVMNYKAPWPCDMVFSSKSMLIYSDIFQFLLQLKWAKYSLDCLRFSDLQGSAAHESLMHRMFIFKMSLLNFVNSFQNYIMTRILHSVGLEYLTKLDACQDFDEILYIHSCYLDTIHDRCLLHEKVSVIKKLIIKVLQMSLDVSRMWKSKDIRERVLQEMELEYNRCIQFLSSMIRKVIARGSKAHLELLAFTFNSCINSPKFK